MSAVFLQVLNMSLTASYVILFVLAARLLLKKAPKIFSYALWGIVLFRLICPFSFESLFSLLLINPEPIPSNITYAELPQINTGIDLFDSAVNPILSAQTAAQGASINPMQIWISIGQWAWFAGITVLLIYSIISLLCLRSKLIGAVKWQDNIYLADHIESPFVMGLLRPKIYLPSTLSEQEHEYIILHEQTHIKRLDHIVKIVAFLVLTVHWFNPLVWMAFFLCVKDMEMSCDESVMKGMDTDIRREYSASLLSLATGRKIVAGIPLAFGEGDTKSRIKNVMNYKKPTFWIVIVALVAVLAVCIGLAVNPHNNDSFTDNLLQYRTEYIGDNSKVGGIISALKYPDKVTYHSFELYTEGPPLMVTVKLDTGTETRNFYTGAMNEGPFRKNAIIMFALIQNAEYITFELDDGTNPYSMQFTRDMADRFVDGDVWSYSSSPEQFETLLQMVESIEVTEPEPWNPQPEYKNRDDYLKALEAAQQSVNNEEIVVTDMGSNEKTALAWMDMWFDLYKALPEDNMAHITEGVVDDLNIIMISKKGLPKAFVFSVTLSIRPTYPIASNGFWMPGNTGNSPGRDETWGQLYREVALRVGDDGRYYFVEIGTGGVGRSEEFELIALQQATEKRTLITEADVTHDSINERFYLDKSQIKERLVTLRIIDAYGVEIWGEQLSTSHAGWNQLFLCELDDKKYLLRYNPAMYQGYCTYVYTLFTLENDKEKVFSTNKLEFDINGTKELDVPKMTAFADEVNDLLGKSTLLISSNGGDFSFGPYSAEPFFERFSWLDKYKKLFEDEDSLESKLNKFSEYAVLNRKLIEHRE